MEMQRRMLSVHDGDVDLFYCDMHDSNIEIRETSTIKLNRTSQMRGCSIDVEIDLLTTSATRDSSGVSQVHNSKSSRSLKPSERLKLKRVIYEHSGK